MLYLFLGNASVGLLILLGIPVEDALTSGQYVFLIAFSVFLDLLPTVGYLVGRYFSKQPKLHWETLLGFGLIIGVVTQVLLPEFGLREADGSSYWYIPAALCLVIAFVPPHIEVWRKSSE